MISRPASLRPPLRTAPAELRPRAGEVVGVSARRPDGVAKTTGEFAYSSDLWMEGMLWGVTLRSPHPFAQVRSVDIGPALATPGVYAVLTDTDVPGANRYGLEFADQPVLAEDVVRYQGEPVAVVAAGHPEVARRAAARIAVGLRGAGAGHQRPRGAGRRCPAAAPGRQRRAPPEAAHRRSGARGPMS